MNLSLSENKLTSLENETILNMKNGTILIVDNSGIDNFICIKVLELHGCSNIKICNNDIEAIFYLETEKVKPCLIIVNLELPYNAGFNFIDKLKKNELLDKKTLLVATVSSGLPSIYREANERNLNLIEKPITYDKAKDLLYSKN